MTEFYNRYRGLFDSVPNHPRKDSFLSKKQLFYDEPRLPYSLKPTLTPVQEGRKHANHLNIGRSPALDQFQRNVLPKLNKRYPVNDYYRLKTQMQQNTSKLEESLVRNNSPQLDFYQLPKIYPPQVNPIKRERILTEGSAPQKAMQKFRDVKNISKNIEQLQKQYFKHYYPPQQDKIVEEAAPQILQHHTNKSRLVAQQQKASRINHNISNIFKRWENKVLNPKQTVKHQEESSQSPKQDKNNSLLYKAYQNRQNQLYGIRQNPFAFVNSKLQEIKRSEKYYPRGYINSYREALFRRRKQKNNIEGRREKLRILLNEDDLKFGVA